MSNMVAFLTEVKQTIATMPQWTKGCLARDGDMNQVGPEDTRACSFCLVGAVMRVGAGLRTEDTALLHLFTVLNRNKAQELLVTTFNDTHTFEEVHDLLDATIEDVKENEL